MSNAIFPTEWQKMPIKNVYVGMYDGVHGTPPSSQDGPVFLGIKNLTDDGKFDFSDIRHISEEDFARWTKRILPKEGDIVFTYEATLHRYAIIPRGFKGCLGRRLALIRPDNNKIVTKYLFYYFFSEEWRNTINKNIFSGATVDRIPIIHFPNFEINVPSLPIQQKIANILSSYDDLIENNTQRIKILEEMAQVIYREWFVNFRFPGHEGVRMVESELGLVPDGWEVSSIEKVCSKIASGGTPSRNNENYWNPGTITWYKTKELRDNFQFDSEEKISENGLRNSSAKIFPKDTIVIALYASPTLGRLGILTHDSTFNQAMCGLITNEKILNNYYLFLSLLNSRAYFQRIALGAAQQNINVLKLRSAPILIPEKELNDLFHEICNPIFLQIKNLNLKNTNLRRTRDILLPKLISGELDVSGLDIDIPADL